MFCCNGKNWLTLTNFVYLMNFYNCFAFQKALFLCENVVKCFILKFNSFRFSHLLEYFISLWIMLVQSIQHMLQIAGSPSEFVSFVLCYIKWPFWLGEGEQHRRLELSITWPVFDSRVTVLAKTKWYSTTRINRKRNLAIHHKDYCKPLFMWS